jgi:hypothetical protein
MIKRLLCSLVLALSLGIIPTAGTLDVMALAYAGNCVAKDNLRDKAQSFISRCRKGSINREFPREMLDKTLGEIKKGRSSTHKKAWKLLNDARFAK